jgi:tRNA (guanine37-N1)-methyltransferase
VRVWDLRAFTDDPHRSVDDEAFGGGPGMVLKPEPVFAAVESLDPHRGRVLLLGPAGRRLEQSLVRELAAEPHLTLICGRYEGVDERVVDGLPAEEVSIGDYVLSGGEVPALVVIEAVTRLVPGVIGKEESHERDSFSEPNLLDHPHYTRPQEFRGMRVPDVLVSGHHAEIERWRRDAAIRKTRRNRPDLLGDHPERSG